MRKVRKKLVIEPKEIDNYEVYSDKELAKMLAEDKLPNMLAKKDLRIGGKKPDLEKEFVGKFKPKGKINGVKEINMYYQKKGLKISG